MEFDFKKLINQGKKAWNNWMLENPSVTVDISEFDLSNKDLSGYDFSVITAHSTNFSNCKLIGADFGHADLLGANFEGANITKTRFDNANLVEVNLISARGIEADFYQASLESANLSNGIFIKAKFIMSRLVSSKLDGADITDAIMWESQRTLWSINNIICERCFWGAYKYNSPSEYVAGEFEKLHKHNPIIKVHFSQGIKPLEFYSVPHLVHGVANMFDDCRMRISSISEAGKGAEVRIVLEEHKKEQFEQIKTTLNHMPNFLRQDNNISYLEGVNKGLQITLDKLVQELIKKI